MLPSPVTLYYALTPNHQESKCTLHNATEPDIMITRSVNNSNTRVIARCDAYARLIYSCRVHRGCMIHNKIKQNFFLSDFHISLTVCKTTS